MCRIGDIRALRAGQFPEDAGPLAHPVQPQSYLRIDNFYTATVYNKGAELIRMMHTLLGRDGFRRGMDLYIQRHDNSAATIPDFVAAMQDASGVDLGEFARWYHQAGTPEITVEDRYDPATQKLRADRLAEDAADARPAREAAGADPDRDGAARPQRRRDADPARRRGGGAGRHAAARLRPSRGRSSALSMSRRRRCRRCCAASRRR